MELLYQLKASTKEVFTIVMDSFLYDINQSTSKNVRRTSFKKGFSYTKKEKRGSYTFRFVEFEESVHYLLQVESTNGVTRMEMTLEDLGEYLCDVTYSEDFTPHNQGKVNSLSYKISNKLYQNKTRKKAMKMFRQIEMVIKNNKKKENN